MSNTDLNDYTIWNFGAADQNYPKDYGTYPANGYVVFYIKNDQSHVIPKITILKKYLFVLLHEIGHIDDFNKKINIDPLNNKSNVIEAEVYANCYALRELYALGFENEFHYCFQWIESWIKFSNTYHYDVSKGITKNLYLR